MMDGKAYYDFLKIVIICILWYLCSTSDNIIGKIILTDYHFPYPMTVSMVHLSTAAVFLGPVKKILNVPKGKMLYKRYYYIMIFPLAFGKFLSSVSSYISIWKVSVSYAHTVKATLPMFTVLLSRIILGEKQTWPVYLALVPIITGVCVATATELSFDSVGLASSIFATICFSLQTIFTKKCLKDTEYHHLELLTFITRISAVLFFPIWLLFDFRRIYHNEEFLSSGNVLQTCGMLFCAGFFSMMHNVFAFSVLALVSPLSYAVANATKRIAIIGGSLLILQNPVGPMNILGMSIAIFGVLSYNKAKYNQNQAERKQQLLPHIHSMADVHKADSSFGVPHLPHSKSDANMLNGHVGQRDYNASNGLLLQEYDPGDNFTLLPLAEQDGEVIGRRATVGLRQSVSKTGNSSSSDTHSRSVFLV